LHLERIDSICAWSIITAGYAQTASNTPTPDHEKKSLLKNPACTKQNNIAQNARLTHTLLFFLKPGKLLFAKFYTASR
jgi:hypothetical protein